MTGHGPVRVTVTVECRCGATGDHVLTGRDARTATAARLRLSAAAAYVEHLAALIERDRGKP